MYRKMIIGYDGSERAEDGLALGKLIAEAGGADLVVAGVFQFDPMSGRLHPDFQEAEADYRREIDAPRSRFAPSRRPFPAASAGRGLRRAGEEIGADRWRSRSPARRGRAGPGATAPATSGRPALLHGRRRLGGDRPASLRHGRDPRSSRRSRRLRAARPRPRWRSRTRDRAAHDAHRGLAQAGHRRRTPGDPATAARAAAPEPGWHALRKEAVEETIRGERLEQATAWISPMTSASIRAGQRRAPPPHWRGSQKRRCAAHARLTRLRATAPRVAGHRRDRARPHGFVPPLIVHPRLRRPPLPRGGARRAGP